MSAQIDSPKHPRIAAVRRLHRRSSREEERRFVVEGRQAVAELLRYSMAIEIYATDSAAQRNADILGGHEVQLVSERVAAALSDTVTPQGLIAVAELLPTALTTGLPPAPGLVAGLVNARDPGNAGTVIRLADAFGADAVVLAGDCVDPHNPKVVRSATGSHFHLPVLIEPSVPGALAQLRGHGYTLLAADSRGSLELQEAASSGLLANPTAWIFGNEAHGLDETDLAAMDAVVRIAIYGQAESLNLAAAAAICLHASAAVRHGDHDSPPALGSSIG